MAAQDAQTAVRVARMGMGMLQPKQALAVAAAAVGSAQAVQLPVMAAVHLTWPGAGSHQAASLPCIHVYCFTACQMFSHEQLHICCWLDGGDSC